MVPKPIPSFFHCRPLPPSPVTVATAVVNNHPEAPPTKKRISAAGSPQPSTPSTVQILPTNLTFTSTWLHANIPMTETDAKASEKKFSRHSQPSPPLHGQLTLSSPFYQFYRLQNILLLHMDLPFPYPSICWNITSKTETSLLYSSKESRDHPPSMHASKHIPASLPLLLHIKLDWFIPAGRSP